MQFRVTNPKITPKHLSLLAVIYIRQSSKRQVIEHQASGIYQRSFSELARSYGWEDHLIKEIDLDDARSATDTIKRTGFQWIRDEVYEGRVGAIVCWEASRLGRDNSDFAQLVKLCAAADTLIIDEKGVYDPNNLNDRIYLGIMGVLYDAESRKTGDRSKATKRMRAEAGKLPLRPATGYVNDSNGHLVLDPRKQVQKTIRLFFSKFVKLESATKVVKYFNRNKIKFPTLIRSRGMKSEIVWGELSITRALHILKNHMYAGTYAYGLTKTIAEMLAADATDQKKKKVKVSLDSDEPIIIHGSHEGYITWERYIQNQKILEDNRYEFPTGSRGAIRDGSALLQGMVVCGMCLGKLTTHYDGRDGSGNYVCGNKVKHFGKYACLSITAQRLDRDVTDALLEAVTPAQLQLTLRELEEVDKETREDDSHEQDELEIARAECNEARLRFESIDPRHTEVFREYEKKLQEKMVEVKRLEKKCAKALKLPRKDLTNKVLGSLLALPQDLRIFWECAAVTNAERKQLLRCLIRQVTVKRRENSKYQDVVIHWVSGATTTLTIVANGNFLHPEAVELMRRLAPHHTVSQIIEHLHEAGFKSKGGKEWFSRTAVCQAFRAYGIKLSCPEMPLGDNKPRGDGRFSTPMVAKMLNVSANTVYIWCVKGVLDAVRRAPRGAYWIKITPEQVAVLKRPYAIKRPRRKID